MDEPEHAGNTLAWQSQAVLLLVCPAAAVYAFLQVTATTSPRLLAAGAGFSILFAVIVLAARAATVGAALLGALLAFCFSLHPGAWHSPLWALAAMLVLTLGASRIGRSRKQAQDPSESRHGRTASQVAANLGVAALAGTLVNRYGMAPAQTVLLAALAEAAADTLASELGRLAAAPPRMLLTGKVAAPGTDGAVSIPGTLAGLAGAALVALVCAWCFALPVRLALLGWGAAVFGLFFDSLLGQLLERRARLNNDAVNFLSTLAAAAAALLIAV